MTTNRFLCIHGHFYQPPRENPWSGAIERQPSAAPYHDWNERITAECYAPNAAARILGPAGELREVNNYARISFNFGPTLLGYLERQAPRVYRAILDADRESLQDHGGHGSALAQAYNHTILPLATREDKRTQVVWGLRDFEHRFGRKPSGLWLPETAVDIETLEVLAEEGLRFTLLAPQQAGRWRPHPDGIWRDGAVPTRAAYEQRLPSGRSIALFFYDGSLASAVAFHDLLDDGKTFLDRLTGAFETGRTEPQLVHLATDGESYGHHRKFGEMALAWTLDRIVADRQATLTNYAEFLARFPPRGQVEIVERSSWSCAHGVERWRSDCSCGAPEEHPEWSRGWRVHLRLALDDLRERLDRLFEERAGRLVRDPWAARRGYIDVVLDGSNDSRFCFLETHRSHALSAPAVLELWNLLEMQRHSMLMFTSCGWFFEDLARIETLQVLRYAARAAEIAREVSGVDVETELLRRLELARSNDPDCGNGREIYEQQVP